MAQLRLEIKKWPWKGLKNSFNRVFVEQICQFGYALVQIESHFQKTLLISASLRTTKRYGNIQMQLILDSNMDKYSIFFEKYESFRRRPGMFLVGKIFNEINIEYESVAAFIAGLDFFQGEGVMNEFREWLLMEEDAKSSAFGWPHLVNNIYKSSERYSEEKINLVEFLFNKIDDFLKLKAVDLSGSKIF